MANEKPPSSESVTVEAEFERKISDLKKEIDDRKRADTDLHGKIDSLLAELKLKPQETREKIESKNQNFLEDIADFFNV